MVAFLGLIHYEAKMDIIVHLLDKYSNLQVGAICNGVGFSCSPMKRVGIFYQFESGS